MGVMGRIRDFRQNHILAQARPHLDEDEEVVGWARVRQARDRRRHGFFYLTEQRAVVVWAGRDDGHGAIRWEELRSWGVNGDTSGGPVLGLEGESGSWLIQMTVTTTGSAEHVAEVLDRFGRLASAPEAPLSIVDDPQAFRADTRVNVNKEKRTIAAHTKRVVVTTVGVAFVVAGLAMMVLPGPGILTILIGLGVLGNEYDWAKDLLLWAKGRYKDAAKKLKERRG